MTKSSQRFLLEDVARAAAVSTASVSRVLNNAPHVSERLRSRVQAAIDELGYVPHGTARALATRRVGAIAALVPTLDNPIFSTMIEGLERRLKWHDYRLLIATYHYDLQDEVEALRGMIQQGVDGTILVGHDHLAETLRLLALHEVPYLSCWHATRDPDWPTIGFENATPACQLAEHLVMLGHRDIAVVCAPTTSNDRARARLKGFRQALESAGISLAPEHVVTVEYGIAEGSLALERLMRLTPRPSAILCGNDTLAFGVMLAAQKLGLRIPEDLSVTGFDDLPQARFMTPALTTVAVPAADIGTCLADTLVARMKGQNVPHYQQMEAPIVIRGSTGPAPDVATSS